MSSVSVVGEGCSTPHSHHAISDMLALAAIGTVSQSTWFHARQSPLRCMIASLQIIPHHQWALYTVWQTSRNFLHATATWCNFSYFSSEFMLTVQQRLTHLTQGQLVADFQLQALPAMQSKQGVHDGNNTTGVA